MDSIENNDDLANVKGEIPLQVRVDNFASLLENISSLNDKKRRLWREIYENAIIDRQNAYAMFIRLATITGAKSTEHAVHGKTMATYIEKMSKANDQLIRLAEMIADADESSSDKGEILSSDDLYSRMNK